MGETKKVLGGCHESFGVDYGDARTGIAISDLTCSLVGTTLVIHSRNPEKTTEEIVKLVKENQVGEIVVGLPKNMDGTEGARAELCRRFAAGLEEASGLPVRLWDERRTTVEAHNILSAHNYHGKKRKNTVDAVAASLILEGYLMFRGAVEQFPQAHSQQQKAEELPKHPCVQVLAQPGKDPGGDAACDQGGKQFPYWKGALLSMKQAGYDSTGKEKRQVDGSGGCRLHAGSGNQPKHQQTSAADAHAGQKAQHGGEKEREQAVYHISRTPPYRIRIPIARCRRQVGILFPHNPAAVPPAALPTR